MSETETKTTPEASSEPTEGRQGGRRRYSLNAEKNRCRFCRDKIKHIDYKDLMVLQKLCTAQGRLFSRKRSGNCAQCQRNVKRAIKRARFIGLLSHVGRD